jgi:hypothetical protein
VRVLPIALLALALLPATASAEITVEIDDQIPLLLITDPDGENDNVVIGQDGSFNVISSVNGIDNSAADCAPFGTNRVRCLRQGSISVDLGAGNDSFRTEGVADPIAVAGGSEDDTLSGGLGADVLAGGPGNDRLNGGAGVDDYFGEDGADVIDSLDGAAERLSCGGGGDTVRNDFIDVLAECETGTDGDGDNFNSAVDCDEGNALISPGAAEIFENGIDENCDGRDAVNLDRDADGFPVPADCDDANGAIRPGALEIRGNGVDENCDTRAEPFALLRALVLNNWEVDGGVTVLRKLQVRNAPRGARVVFRCSGPGCPIRRRARTVPRDLAPITLHAGFRRARLRPGARLTVTVTAAETTGRTWSYAVKRGALPDPRTTCRAPGETRSRTC